VSIYKKLSTERKKLQEEGEVPEWYTTAGYQLFKERYAFPEGTTPRQQYQRIANTLAVHTPDPGKFRGAFFELLWNGWLSPSTPVLSNTGTVRGLPVSCAGSYLGDSIDAIYGGLRETAALTKAGFGTASYLGDIRPRGTKISVGGYSSGVLPVLQTYRQSMSYVSQGTARRGSWAGYLPIDHGDFEEVCLDLQHNPDGNNIGWCVSDEFINRLESGDADAVDRYELAMYTKMLTGKGYFFFTDKANAKRPPWYVDKGLDIKSPQLCAEIMLHSDEDHTYTCVLSSMNLAKYDEWTGTDAVFNATVFLDAVVQEFLEKSKNTPGLEKAWAFTKKSRALGLGVCGFHTLLQQKRYVFGDFYSIGLNREIFRELDAESKRASEWIAEEYGVPEWMDGYGMANTHRIAVAPTKSTALIMGGISEGINPDTAMVYTQRTAAGEVDRINPELLKLMHERGVYSKRTVERIRDAMGSVQDEDWLDDHEKDVFKTAFEIPQMSVVTMASQRAEFIDQWQSLNLFFSAEEDEEYVTQVHKTAFKDPNILALYYVYSKAGVQASKDECLSCM